MIYWFSWVVKVCTMCTIVLHLESSIWIRNELVIAYADTQKN